ncbi:MAG: sigma-54 interaction domain-containing protein, partial [Nitrospinaceae bacterium]
MPGLKDDSLDTLLDLLNEAVFVYNQDMRITHFNAAAERITGHAKAHVLGQKCVTIFDQSLCLNNCQLCMTVKRGERKRVDFESPFLRQDGVRRLGKFHAGRLHTPGADGVRVLVSLTDITELARLRRELHSTHSFRKLTGKSPIMQDLFHSIRNVAEYDSTVCLYGESGTGKELAARAIHHESPRADGPLVKVNCSAFSDSLLESELFGHEKGAFTGAVRDRRGRFEEADCGTLFLDEVGDLYPRVQVKLLRVLQEKEVERVGENQTRKVNIRVIAATHKNLLGEVEAGRFRQDLFYRLNVIPLHLPPLRHRREDIPLLAEHFLKRWNAAQNKKVEGLAAPALGLLMDKAWPGNVRELANAIEHACVKTVRPAIQLEDLPAYLWAGAPSGPRRLKPRRRLNRHQIQTALHATGGNQTQAARRLGIHRIT